MSFVESIKDILTRPAPEKKSEQPIESYWCYDCGERLLADEVDTDTPGCPSCGEPMEYERSTGTVDCAC